MNDTLNSWMIGILSTGFGQVLNWGVPQLVMAVLATLAARRHKLLGIWLLAVAAIFSFALRFALALVVVLIPSRGDSARIFAPLNFYPSLLILLIAILGWAMLAFPRTKKASQ